MSALDDLLDREAVAGLLGLASAAASGARIGLADTEGSLVAGWSAGPVPPRTHPVLLDGRAVGAVVGDDEVPRELLALVARSLELAIAGRRDHANRVRVEHELAIGHSIQLALLPRRFPIVDGWTFAAQYEPAREIGGDLYDAFPLRGRTDRIALLIADVTGKGIPAALLMADVRALLHAATDNADGPADALARVNRILVRERPTSLFVTASLVLIDTSGGTILYASAGHEPALLVRTDGEANRLDAAGPILGAFADATFDERTAELGAGEALVLYTDGITETRDEDRHFYGEDRLLAAVARSRGRVAGAIVESLVADVRAFRGGADAFDDLTVLVTERRPG